MAPLQKPKTLFEDYRAESPMATEFRRLFVRMKRLAGDAPLQTLLITSASRGEGKTTAATQLAMTAALYGRRSVALVDLDLRRPRVHEVTGVSQRPGATDVLSGQVALHAALKSTPIPNFAVLPSGRIQHGPSAMLASPRMRELIEDLKSRYDFVVVDAPPVIPVTDPMVLAPLVDATLLVVMAGETPRQVVARARSLLVDTGTRLLGVIVNNVDEVLPYHYDYNYYGYETDSSPEEPISNGKESS